VALLLLSLAASVQAKPYEVASCGPSSAAAGYAVDADSKFPVTVTYSKASTDATTTFTFEASSRRPCLAAGALHRERPAGCAAPALARPARASW
jgi:hypothetical protein